MLLASNLFGAALDEQQVKTHLSSERDHIFVAFLSGQPAAFLRAHELSRLDEPPKFSLYAIETSPHWRRRGLIRALIGALKALAR